MMAARDIEPQTVNDLPAGTVTFLFTDIEGSTQLLQQLRERYADLLSEHHHILRDIFTQYHGREVDTQGDAFFVAFSRASDAVAAVVAAQKALMQHSWPGDVTVRVRMGLHTGEPLQAVEGYVGMDVHRAARVAHIGYGGQVLLSETAVALVRDDLPEGVELQDLGRHLLKDLNRPEHIHQLVVAGLPSEFPALKSLHALPPERLRAPRQVGECPYRGLFAFRERDAQFFFGRETFVDALEAAVKMQAIVAVILGPSGSGKSSALFAGLVPRLRQEQGWHISVMRPGSKPFHALAGALVPLLSSGLTESEHLRETGQLARHMMATEVDLGMIVTRVLEREEGARQVLLIIDQFEELYTLCQEKDLRRAFIDALLDVAAMRGDHRQAPCVVLLTLRADFMGEALTHRPFADMLQRGSLLMGPMTRKELRAAVEQPAQMQGAAFEPGLVERLLDDVGEEPGNLPLLQFALTLLWNEQTDGWLTHDNYEAIGEVEGALSRYADEIYQNLSEEEREQARRIFVQMVKPGEGTADTRRVARREELGEAQWRLVQYLADKRLVVTGHDVVGGDETVEVVHEALIQRWSQLRRWMQDDRAFRIWQEHLRAAMRQWQASEEDEGALLRGAPLVEAEQWLEDRGEQLSTAERVFILEGVHQRERREQERTKQRRRIMAGLVAGLAIAIILATVAFGQRQEALRQASIGLASLAEEELDGIDRELSVLLALEAVEHYPFTPQALGALAHSVEEFRSFRVLFSPSVAGNMMVAGWSPDGQRIAAGTSPSPDSVVIWDAESGNEQLSVNAHEGLCLDSSYTMHDLVWSPSGDRLAAPAQETDGHHCGIVVFDATSGETLLTLKEDESAALSLDWSPDGKFLLSGHEDGLVRLRDASSGEERLTLAGHIDAVRDTVFSPDGGRIASGSADGTIRLWDSETGTEQLTLSSHAGIVRSIAWSPDGDHLVSGGSDGLPRVWDTKSGEILLTLPGHTEEVANVTWSADGQRIATQGLEAVVKVWDAATGGLIFQITNTATGASNYRGFVEFSPDGQWILTPGSRVLGVHIWDASTSVPKLFGHTYGQEWGAWSPDGTLVATAGTDGSARLWDAVTGKQIRTFDRGSFWSDWSPDGTRLVFADGVAAHALAVWDVATGDMQFRLSAPDDEFGSHQFLGSAWSPDGSYIAAPDFRPGLQQQAVYIWDVETHEIVSTLETDDTCMQGWPRWSPDSTQLATGCIFVEPGTNTPARIWDVTTEREVTRLESEDGFTYRTTWSPDGTRFLTSYENGVIKIWDSETWKPILTFTGHQGIAGGEWSPDGTMILSTDYQEQEAKIWDSQTGEELFAFSVPGAPLTSNWSPDGTHVIVTADGLNVPLIKRVWSSTEELIDYAYDCCVFRELTPEERVQFGLPDRR